jgi:hypothetical protein
VKRLIVVRITEESVSGNKGLHFVKSILTFDGPIEVSFASEVSWRG